jgi:hypothetical protein
MNNLLSKFKIIEEIKKSDFYKIADIIKNLDANIEFLSKSFPLKEFYDYIDLTKYNINFPYYYKEFGSPRFPEYIFKMKMFEHFWSIYLSPISEDFNVLDVASGNSPFCKIIQNFFPCDKTFKQDQQYSEDTKNGILGGDAAQMNIVDNCVDNIYLHNSWEHFEGTSDCDFLTEASRILCNGGKIVITPIFLAENTYQVTSPSCWDKKWPSVQTGIPNFDISYPIVIDESIQQRLEKHISPEFLANLAKKTNSLNFRIIFIEDYIDYDFIPNPFTLIATKSV